MRPSVARLCADQVKAAMSTNDFVKLYGDIKEPLGSKVNFNQIISLGGASVGLTTILVRLSTEQQLGSLTKEMDERFKHMDERFKHMDECFKHIDTHLRELRASLAKR